MTNQRKSYIIGIFHKKERQLIDKLKQYPNIDRVNIISIYQELGSYRCMLNYSYIKKRFISIYVLEETINL